MDPNRSQTLYDEFSTALLALPEDEETGALDVAESFVNGACHHCSRDVVLSLVEMGCPADRLVLLFDGRTVGEAAAVITQLRSEIADALARRGAPAEVVRAIRENGPKADRRAETA